MIGELTHNKNLSLHRTIVQTAHRLVTPAAIRLDGQTGLHANKLTQLAEFFLGNSQLLQDLVIQPAANFSAGMDWNSRRPAILVLPAGVTAFLPRLHKTELRGGAHQLLRFSGHASR